MEFDSVASSFTPATPCLFLENVADASDEKRAIKASRNVRPLSGLRVKEDAAHSASDSAATAAAFGPPIPFKMDWLSSEATMLEGRELSRSCSNKCKSTC